MGPVGVQRLCGMLEHGEIDESTLTRAAADNDDCGWLPLRKRTALLMAVLLNTSSPLSALASTQASEPGSHASKLRQGVSLIAKCLRVLLSCCRACPATNSDGAVVWPLPLPRARLLFGDGCLQYLVQVLLLKPPQQVRGESEISESVSSSKPSSSSPPSLSNGCYSEREHSEILGMCIDLLLTTLEGDYIDAMPKLYLSGMFYFSLLLASSFDNVGSGSAGSSAGFLVDAIGRLLYMAHLRQRFPLWQPLPTSSASSRWNDNDLASELGESKAGQQQQQQSSQAHRRPRQRISSSSSFSAPSVRKSRMSGHLLARASILGTLLPESMICMLEYNIQRNMMRASGKAHARGQAASSSYSLFARILLGNAATPEVIWTPSMLTTLRNCLFEHLAPFCASLRLDPTLQYQFEPCPPVEYEQLNAELYCHSYFLRNLCDSTRFLDWPVPDPEGVLRDIIDAWRSELATAADISKGQSMPFPRAAEVMGLSEEFQNQQITSSVLRKVYLRLALKLHPDRNGRDDGSKGAFTELHLAYKRLTLVASGRADTGKSNPSYGTSSLNVPMSDVVTTHLLLRTQSLLFDRFSTKLGAFKYPMFPTLVKICGSGRITDPAPRLAMRALAQIASASTNNARELLMHSGFELIVSALRASVGVAAANTNACATYCACLTAVAAIMSVEEGRARLATCAVIKGVLYDSLLSQVSGGEDRAQGESASLESQEIFTAALASVHHVSLCSSIEARSSLVERGCLYPLLKIALVPPPASSTTKNQPTVFSDNVTAARPWGRTSYSAVYRREQALKILLSFAGFRVSGAAVTCDDEHMYVRNALERLLSDPLLRILARSYAHSGNVSDLAAGDSKDNDRIAPKASSALHQIHLSLTASADLLSQASTISPLLIWDEGMRATALSFIEKQIFTFDGTDEDPAVSVGATGASSSTSAALSMFSKALGPVLGFSHERLRNEPLVGGVYLKPFVAHVSSTVVVKSRSSTSASTTSSSVRSAPSTLSEFGIDSDQFISDLVQYIEGAARASSLVSRQVAQEQAALAAAKFQDSIASGGLGRGFGIGGRGGLHADGLYNSAKAAAEAAATSVGRLLGVLYALKAICKLLDGGRGDASATKTTTTDSGARVVSELYSGGSNANSNSHLSYAHQLETLSCSGSCASFLVHHVSSIFACAYGHPYQENFARLRTDSQEYKTCVAALQVIQKSCRVLKNLPPRESDTKKEAGTPSPLQQDQTPPGRLFARSAVEAGVLWMLLDPLRGQSPCPQPQLTIVLRTLLCVVSASPVASANLAGIGVTVDVMQIFADPNLHTSSGAAATGARGAGAAASNDGGMNEIGFAARRLAATFLSSLASQPSCGGQVRSTLLRMLPARMVMRLLGNSRCEGGGGGSAPRHTGMELHTSASAVRYFDSDHDTAELFWDGKCREELCKTLASLRAEIVQRIALSAKSGAGTTGAHAADGAISWMLPRGFVVPYTAYVRSFVVSRVFVRTFLRDTTVTLSDPVQFAIELIRVLSQSPDGQGNRGDNSHGSAAADSGGEQLLVTPRPEVTTKNLSLLVRAFVALLMQNPELASHVARAGLLPHLLHRLVDAVGEDDTQQACLSVITQLVMHSQIAVAQVRFYFVRMFSSFASFFWGGPNFFFGTSLQH